MELIALVRRMDYWMGRGFIARVTENGWLSLLIGWDSFTHKSEVVSILGIEDSALAGFT